MKIDRDKVKKILVIGLSNIGDAILTTPVVQVLRQSFTEAHLAVLVGPRAFSVFKNDPRIDNTIIYDKKLRLRNKLSLLSRLRRDKYDLVVDLRHCAFSLFLGARYRSPVFLRPKRSAVHMKDKHLGQLKPFGLDSGHICGPCVIFSEEDRNYIKGMQKKWQIKDEQNLVAIAPGARNMTKRWMKEEYRQLIMRFANEYNARVIMIGDEHDKLLVSEIISKLKPLPANACGKTTIGQLGALLSRCRLLVSNDSAPMHLAWAINTPVVALFGPTDQRKYAPLGPKDIIIRKDLSCSPCEKSLCPKGTRECMKLITVDEVFSACRTILDERL